MIKISAQKGFGPLASSRPSLFRLSSTLATCSQPPHRQAVRNFSSHHSPLLSSKRKMQTIAAYQPYPLETPPPLPQNPRFPDTAIAGGTPQLNDTRPPEQMGHYEIGISPSVEGNPSVGLSRQEAQKTSPAPTVSQQPRQKTRPKLRARKAAMKLTPGAVKQLQAILRQPEPKFIKIGVKNRGCSGLAYHLEYVEKPGMFDEEVEQDGVKVLIDSKALFSIIGSEMDWVEDKLNQRFVFKNPNISKTHISLYRG